MQRTHTSALAQTVDSHANSQKESIQPYCNANPQAIIGPLTRSNDHAHLSAQVQAMPDSSSIKKAKDMNGPLRKKMHQKHMLRLGGKMVSASTLLLLSSSYTTQAQLIPELPLAQDFDAKLKEVHDRENMLKYSVDLSTQDIEEPDDFISNIMASVVKPVQPVIDMIEHAYHAVDSALTNLEGGQYELADPQLTVDKTIYGSHPIVLSDAPPDKHKMPFQEDHNQEWSESHKDRAPGSSSQQLSPKKLGRRQLQGAQSQSTQYQTSQAIDGGHPIVQNDAPADKHKMSSQDELNHEWNKPHKNGAPESSILRHQRDDFDPGTQDSEAEQSSRRELQTSLSGYMQGDNINAVAQWDYLGKTATNISNLLHDDGSPTQATEVFSSLGGLFSMIPGQSGAVIGGVFSVIGGVLGVFGPQTPSIEQQTFDLVKQMDQKLDTVIAAQKITLQSLKDLQNGQNSILKAIQELHDRDVIEEWKEQIKEMGFKSSQFQQARVTMIEFSEGVNKLATSGSNNRSQYQQDYAKEMKTVYEFYTEYKNTSLDEKLRVTNIKLEFENIRGLMFNQECLEKVAIKKYEIFYEIPENSANLDDVKSTERGIEGFARWEVPDEYAFVYDKQSLYELEKNCKIVNGNVGIVKARHILAQLYYQYIQAISDWYQIKVIAQVYEQSNEGKNQFSSQYITKMVENSEEYAKALQTLEQFILEEDKDGEITHSKTGLRIYDESCQYTSKTGINLSSDIYWPYSLVQMCVDKDLSQCCKELKKQESWYAPTSKMSIKNQVSCDYSNCLDYRGTRNETRSGHTCIFWPQDWIDFYPNDDLIHHNHCRNPDRDSDFWCFTDRSTTGLYWEYCDQSGEQVESYYNRHLGRQAQKCELSNRQWCNTCRHNSDKRKESTVPRTGNKHGNYDVTQSAGSKKEEYRMCGFELGCLDRTKNPGESDYETTYGAIQMKTKFCHLNNWYEQTGFVGQDEAMMDRYPNNQKVYQKMCYPNTYASSIQTQTMRKHEHDTDNYGLYGLMMQCDGLEDSDILLRNYAAQQCGDERSIAYWDTWSNYERSYFIEEIKTRVHHHSDGQHDYGLTNIGVKTMPAFGKYYWNSWNYSLDKTKQIAPEGYNWYQSVSIEDSKGYTYRDTRGKCRNSSNQLEGDYYSPGKMINSEKDMAKICNDYKYKLTHNSGYEQILDLDPLCAKCKTNSKGDCVSFTVAETEKQCYEYCNIDKNCRAYQWTQPGGIIVCENDNCTDYRGTQNKTRRGHTCRNWPQNWQSYYSNHGLGNHNYCRNPDRDSDLWCLTDRSTTGRYWEFCDREQKVDEPGCFIYRSNDFSGNGSDDATCSIKMNFLGHSDYLQMARIVDNDRRKLGSIVKGYPQQGHPIGRQTSTDVKVLNLGTNKDTCKCQQTWGTRYCEQDCASRRVSITRADYYDPDEAGKYGELTYWLQVVNKNGDKQIDRQIYKGVSCKTSSTSYCELKSEEYHWHTFKNPESFTVSRDTDYFRVYWREHDDTSGDETGYHQIDQSSWVINDPRIVNSQSNAFYSYDHRVWEVHCDNPSFTIDDSSGNRYEGWSQMSFKFENI